MLALVVWVEGAASALIIAICSAVHEMGHFIMLRLCGVEITECEIGLLGAKIYYQGQYTSYDEDFSIASGGILFNFLFSVIGCIMFIFVKNELILLLIASNLALAFVNLLPISFLDGGCMAHAFLSQRCDTEVSQRCCRALDIAGRAVLVAVNLLLLAVSGFNLGLCILLIIQLMGMISA